MALCPTDLLACKRESCRDGVCELAGAPVLLLCWECGAIEVSGVTAGICLSCLATYRNERAVAAS
jgi:hypothetical protein